VSQSVSELHRRFNAEIACWPKLAIAFILQPLPIRHNRDTNGDRRPERHPRVIIGSWF
jgi:hypothetical protein